MKRFTIISALALLLPLAACSSSDQELDSFTFTEKDAAEITALLDKIESEQGAEEEGEMPEGGGMTGTQAVVLDVADTYLYDTLRSSKGTVGTDLFRVTNIFLNVRSEANVRGEKVEELKKGDTLKVLAFPDASWAQVELADGRKGYVSTSYIAQVATDADLPAIKQKYEGQYYVDFAFLNVRSTPNSQGQKLGELYANQIVRPIAFHEEWARIPFEGQEAFVSSQYLRPFAPSIVVRQENFQVPILLYRSDDEGFSDALIRNLDLLKSAGKRIMTLREFYELLLEQEERDTRMPPNAVILAITDITPATMKDTADALRASGVQATLFVQTSRISPDQLSADSIQSLVRGGHDVQSAGHSGDDLRALTNDQVTLDLSRSKQILEDTTGKDVFAVAYPAGGYNDRIGELATAAGYLFGITLMPSADGSFSRSRFLAVPSNLVSATTSDVTLKALVGIK